MRSTSSPPAGNNFAGIADDTTWSFTTQSANSGLFTWDGTANSWASAHWNAGGGRVSGPVGDSSHNSAIINGGTVTFAAGDTFGNALTMASPVITLYSGATLASGGFFNTIWDLALNGGTLLANGGLNSPNGAFALKGTVTIGGTAESNILVGTGNFNTVSLGTGMGGNTTFDVADVSASPAPDLTIITVLNDNSNVASGLIKTGAGTLTLTGANTYTGATTVNAHTLTFTKRQPLATDLTYVIETSPNLQPPWTARVTQTPSNTDATISYALPTGQGVIFARLRVQQ